LEEQNAAADETSTDTSSTDTAEQSSAMAIGFRNRQEDTSSSTIEASQTFSNGFSLYDGINSSDWWIWTLALDMPENLI